MFMMHAPTHAPQVHMEAIPEPRQPHRHVHHALPANTTHGKQHRTHLLAPTAPSTSLRPTAVHTSAHPVLLGTQPQGLHE